MPKTKSHNPKKKKRVRKKQSRPRLGLYLLAGLASVFLMWILIREPMPAPTDIKPETPKTADRKTEQETPKKKPEMVAADPKIVEDSPIVRIIHEETPKPGEGKLDLSIRKAATSIGVPENALKRRSTDDLVKYTIPVDRSQMDLTYANMIFKGNLEQTGATMLKGQDSQSKQVLSFYHSDVPKKYELELYYDSKYYKDKNVPKKISIVVDDFGAIGGSLLDGFLSLDDAVCFAIFPDEVNSQSTMHRATRQGRETLIHVPMEPIGYPSVNPGKNAVLVQHGEAQIVKMLDGFIADLPDAIGINNHMGSLATTDADIMQVVMNTLKKHNKAFLDSRTTNVSVAYQTAQKSHIRAFRNDLFLDSPNISQSTMDAKLNQIIQMSASNKHIIAITHCHNEDKLDYLKSFISRLKKAGFSLVPLSEHGSHEVPEIL